MATQPIRVLKYEKYRLSRLVTVNDIVSADYVRQPLQPNPHTFVGHYSDLWTTGKAMFTQTNIALPVVHRSE